MHIKVWEMLVENSSSPSVFHKSAAAAAENLWEAHCHAPFPDSEDGTQQTIWVSHPGSSERHIKFWAALIQGIAYAFWNKAVWTDLQKAVLIAAGRKSQDTGSRQLYLLLFQSPDTHLPTKIRSKICASLADSEIPKFHTWAGWRSLNQVIGQSKLV